MSSDGPGARGDGPGPERDCRLADSELEDGWVTVGGNRRGPGRGGVGRGGGRGGGAGVERGRLQCQKPLP